MIPEDRLIKTRELTAGGFLSFRVRRRIAHKIFGGSLRSGWRPAEIIIEARCYPGKVKLCIGAENTKGKLVTEGAILNDSDGTIEGIEDGPARDELPSYPLEDVMVRNETRSVSATVKRIQTGRYAMSPDFQRDFVWPADKQSKLIESCIMRIPLPVFYVAEGQDGRVTVVDGLQRLSTFRRYLLDELALTGLGDEHPLTGKYFSDLPLHFQERIEDTQLTLYILDKSAPEAARLDIFERVNSGIPLTRQQMRNALYDGPATRWLSEQSKSSLFRSVTGGSLDSKTMRDREAINRFCAFYLLGWQSYTGGDMDAFLASALREMNKLNDLTELTEAFETGLRRNDDLFNRHAFRKSLVEVDTNAYRSVLNISLFEVMMVELAKMDEDVFAENVEEIEDSLVNLVVEGAFLHAVTYSTNSTRQVHQRFRMIEEVISEYSL